MRNAEMDELDAELLVVDRVEQAIRREVIRLQCVKGAKLPEERVLGRRLQASRRSVREALKRLRRENLIRSIRGKGTFIIPAGTKARGVHLICGETHHPYAMMCVRVLSEELTRRRLSCNLVISNEPIWDWDFISANQPEANGVILVSQRSRGLLETLCRKCAMPVVLVGDMDEEFRSPPVCDQVLRNSFAMAYRATEYLIDRGHRRIALMVWDIRKVGSREMQSGYIEALQAHGIDPDPSWVISFPRLAFTAETKPILPPVPDPSVARQINGWFADTEPPTGFIHSTALETQIRDMLHFYFRDHFDYGSVVAVTYDEDLAMWYSGLQDMAAVTVSLRQIATRALELLLSPRKAGEPPRREILEQVHLRRRINGVWEKNFGF